MELTEEELNALERYRAIRQAGYIPRLDEYNNAIRILSDMTLRLFPVRTYGDLVIRWDDPITPERLVACGFKRYDTETPRGYRVTRYKLNEVQFSDGMRCAGAWV